MCLNEIQTKHSFPKGTGLILQSPILLNVVIMGFNVLVDAATFHVKIWSYVFANMHFVCSDSLDLAASRVGDSFAVAKLTSTKVFLCVFFCDK